ncbi:hypothetical protein D3C80_1817760 [compost metagenome]
MVEHTNHAAIVVDSRTVGVAVRCALTRIGHGIRRVLQYEFVVAVIDALRMFCGDQETVFGRVVSQCVTVTRIGTTVIHT